MKVLLVGGGTGGHLFPLLEVAKVLKKRKPDVDLLYIGPVNKFSQKILTKNGIRTKGILTGKWRRYSSLDNLLDLARFPIGFIQSLIYVLLYMPDVVFSKGGYGSVSPTIAARIYWIPILVHESDVVPGKANRFMGKLADKVAISFAETKKYFKEKKTFLTGNLVREDINKGSAKKAGVIFNLKPDKPVILVMGGSQGAKIINERIAQILPQLIGSYQIIHLVGEGNLKQVDEIAALSGIKIERSDYHAHEFLEEEILDAYKVADLIISRAGANSIAEIAAVKKPSILIPIADSANNHQLYNAHVVAKAGGAIILEESNLKGELLLTQINKIMGDPELRGKLASVVGRFYFPDAVGKIVDALLYLAEEVDDIEGAGLFEK